MAQLPPSRLDELRKRYEENPRRFFAPLANEYRKAGDVEQAISLCQAHLGEQPTNMNGHVVYGQALFAAGRYDEAQVTFSTALGLDPENLIALRQLGDISRLMGDTDSAVEWYSRVLEADPRNDEIQAFIEELKAGGGAPAVADETPAGEGAAEGDAEAAAVGAAEGAAQDAPAPEAEAREDDPASGAVQASAMAGLMPSPAAPVSPVAPPVPPEAVAPVEPVAPAQEVSTESVADEPRPKSPPPGQPRIPLMDVDLDLDDLGDPSEPLLPPMPSTRTSGSVITDMPLADIEFTDVAAATPATPATPAAPATADLPDTPETPDTPDTADTADTADTTEPAAASGLEFDTGLGWDTGAENARDDAPTLDEPMPAPAEPREVFVTETMAELYMRQGLRDEALGVYRKLAQQSPHDDSLQDKIRELEERVASPTPANPGASVAAATRVVRTARHFFAALAQRRALRSDGSPPVGIGIVKPEPAPAQRSTGSVDALFGDQSPDAADEAMGLALAGMVGTADPGAIAGRPTEPAGSELSLDSVFRGDTARRTSGPVARQSQPLKFDQFFSSGDTPPESPAEPPDPEGASADDAQFQNWLNRLKDQ